MTKQTLAERLERWSMPEPNSGCWLWLGALTDGYGVLHANGERMAHRVSYEHYVGPIPEGLVIDHKCRTRCCINPRHMEPVTPAENTRRGWPCTKTHCKHGHALTPDNLYTHTHGWRQCATCKRAYRNRHYRANKIAAST